MPRAKAAAWERFDVVAPAPASPARQKSRGAPLTIEENRRREAASLSADARKMIVNMAGYGFSLKQILEATGVTKSQLRSCKDQLKGAALRKDLAVIDSAFLQAVGGPGRKWEMADGGMTRFWLTHKLGWRPPPERKLELSANIDLNRLSDDQLAQLENLMQAASNDEPERIEGEEEAE